MALYTELKVPLPQDTGYDIKSGNNLNRYIYLRTYRENKKLKHDVLYIGRHIKDPETNADLLIPNDNYFKHYNIELPIGENITSKGAGRAKKRNNNSCSYSETKNNAIVGYGFGLEIFALAEKLQLRQQLEKIFDPMMVKQILGIAMFYLDQDNEILTEIEYFSTRQLSFIDQVITPTIAYDVFKSISKEQIDSFIKLWVQVHKTDDLTCYDVPTYMSFDSHTAPYEELSEWEQNHLPQFNIAFFTSQKSHLPIAYEIYNGYEHDFSDFEHVINQIHSWELNNKLLVIT